MKLKIVLTAMVGILVFSLTACGNPGVATATSNSNSQIPAADTQAAQPNAVSISSTNAFVDSYGTYHVVGEVINNTSEVVSSIELSVEIKDGTGTSLIKDDSGNITPSTKISPMLYSLAPGEATPFEYTYETSQGLPASYNVTLLGQQTGTANRATLKTENVQLVDDGSGWYYLTGELVNTGSQWAHINSMAGAVLDDSRKILSADWTATSRDRTGTCRGRDQPRPDPI